MVTNPSTAAAPARLRLLLVLLCAALAVVLVANSSLSIALTDLGADQGELTWIVDSYALAFAALLLPAGLVADRLGRRTVLVAGLAMFTAASLASAFAPDPAWLIALRAVAGVGAAAVFPVTLSALVDAYPEDRRAFAVGVWSGVSAAGAVFGTLVAGVLLEVFWWGSVQVAFGLAAAGVLVVSAAVCGAIAPGRVVRGPRPCPRSAPMPSVDGGHRHRTGSTERDGKHAESVASAQKVMAGNAAHLARLLRTQRYPAP